MTTRYIGIEQSTDSKCQLTRIERFSRPERALAWAQASPCRLTYDDPEGARNFHHTLRELYELPTGTTLAGIRRDVLKKERATPYHQRGVYFGTTLDRIARAVARVGTRLRVVGPDALEVLR